MEYEVDEDHFIEVCEGIFQKLLCCKVMWDFLIHEHFQWKLITPTASHQLLIDLVDLNMNLGMVVMVARKIWAYHPGFLQQIQWWSFQQD